MSFSSSNKDDQGLLREAVEPVLKVLSQLGGYFTFTDQQGEQFVIARKDEFDTSRRQLSPQEKQLPLESRIASVPYPDEEELPLTEEELDMTEPSTHEDVLFSEEVHHMSPVFSEYDAPLPPPVRVRFEPLKGDLPPELQE